MSKKLLIIILMLTVMLTGCFPSGELKTSSEPDANNKNNVTSSENSDNSESSAPTAPAVPQDLEHVKFNIELDSEYPTELPIIKAKRATFDFEEVKPIFLGDKNVTAEGNGIYYTDDGVTFVVRNDIIAYHTDHYYDNDGENRLIYQIQSAAVKDVARYYMNYPNVNSELEGFPRSEAIERANELVERVGLKYLGEPIVYTLTSEDVDINVAGILMDNEGNELEVHLPKEEEFYFVSYLTTYNEIPAPTRSYTIYEDVSQALSKLDIILTKDRLVDFSCVGMYDEIEVVETSQINCSAETALSKLYDYYAANEGNIKQHYEYSDLNLVYLTYSANYDTGEFTYKPIWCVSGTRSRLDDPATGKQHTDKLIDSTTGFVFNGDY